MMQDNIREINLCNSYLKKAALYSDLTPTSDLAMVDIIVVIPAHTEPELERTLLSLRQCHTASLFIEIVIVVNHDENATQQIKEQNKKSFDMCMAFKAKQTDSSFSVSPIFIELPSKRAGVGLARKIGMDEAVRKFLLCGNVNGIIANFDADCICSDNFFLELSRKFKANKKLDAVSVYFEHDLTSIQSNAEAITAYELHLRYFIQAQRWTGHPFIYHTVGSSMAVRCTSYCSFGGMNKRQAGEDFYFLNKIAKYGYVKDLVSTKVIASARDSDRVPFGTGRAMLESRIKDQLPMTYTLDTFSILKLLFTRFEHAVRTQVDLLNYTDIVPVDMHVFIPIERWRDKLAEIQSNTKTNDQLIKRFYQWFDAFMIMKFCHYYRDSGHPTNDVRVEAKKLWSWAFNELLDLNTQQWLVKFRDWDRNDVKAIS